MTPDQIADVKRELIDRFNMKERKGYLRGGECPSCKKKELYARADEPWLVLCGRLANCAYESTVKDLFPDLFESWSDRYKQTDQQPNAAADAYLTNARGLSLSRLRGTYSQEWYRDAESKETTATVRFTLPGGSWWERLIDRPHRFGKKKANFAPGKSYAGQAWTPPALTDAKLATIAELWIVEGIFDSSAMDHYDIPAAAALSCNNYPAVFLARIRELRKGKPLKLVWALDGDSAGREFTLQWVRKARADGWPCEAATIQQVGNRKQDWNDLHLAHRLAPKDLVEYRYRGALLIARSAKDRALLMYKHTRSGAFSLEFGNRLYWFEFDVGAYQRALKESKEKKGDEEKSEEEREAAAVQLAAKVSEIANCNPEPLYFQRSLLTGEHWYYVRVTTPRGGTVKDTFRGEQLAGAGEFKKRLMSVIAGASFYGTTQQLDRHWSDDLQVIKLVEAIDFVGYSREHSAYLLGEVAVKDGRVFTLNEEDFFDLGRKMHVKAPVRSVRLNINTDAKSFRTDWVEKAWRCWGEKGMVALTFWFGSLFAEQVRARQESFPFLELTGEPGSGKTGLIKFMWKLIGRSGYEGFDPSKATLAARARNFVQVANLPVVLTEGDRKDDTAKAKKFDFNELKTAYNGGSIRALGVKSSGNETIEPPFRGTIIIEQNARVDADPAVLERLVCLDIDKSRHSTQNKLLADELTLMDMSELSHFIILAARAEAKVMECVVTEVPIYARELSATIPDQRMALNHAQLMALFNALSLVVPIRDDIRTAVHAYIKAMAVKRLEDLAEDHPTVQSFWEIYEYVNPGNLSPVLNHSANADVIAVNLTHFDAECAYRHISRPDITDLKKHLPGSRSRKFVEVKNVKSALTGKASWCFVFKRPKDAPLSDAATQRRGSGE